MADQPESVPTTYFVKYSHETVSRPLRSEQGTAAIATEGNKVEIASPVMPS